MKIKQFFLLAAVGLMGSACGNVDNPLEDVPNNTPTTEIPEEAIIKYEFKVTDLSADNDITHDITVLKLTNETGAGLATATYDAEKGMYTVEKSDVASATTVWVEATTVDPETTTAKTYIQKLTADDLTALETSKTLAMATLGDLINSDGTFSAAAEDGKTPVGAIAYLGNDAFTEDGTMVGETAFKGHGLVLCLKNAAQGEDAQWSSETTALEFGEDAKVTDATALKRTANVSGYTNTKTLAEKADAATKYKAAYNAYNYTGLTAPAGTTGWFLPSAQQWVKMQEALGGIDGSTEDLTIKWASWFDNNHTGADKWENAIKKAGDGNYDSMTAAWLYYWSSSEFSAGDAVPLIVFATGTGGDYGFYWSGNDKGDSGSNIRVRPVLAF